VPCVLLRKGQVCLPSAEGPVPARTPEGTNYDPFDVVDRLAADYPLLYLVDLDGIERAQPQLDFLQELSRDATLWVDGGVRTADQAIDILVSGAQRAVLSSATLHGPRELRRAWRLSPELVFEVELDREGLVAPADWGTREASALATTVRGIGVDHLVVSPREVDPDWSLIGRIAAAGPTWVDGSFDPSQLPQLSSSGARGGIFHLDKTLGGPGATDSSSGALPSGTRRDDET
jgi:phosphoribosylformimino-5-aminoimidazole carboxamide ribonucleotide (ProFAR) isomerase